MTMIERFGLPARELWLVVVVVVVLTGSLIGFAATMPDGQGTHAPEGVATEVTSGITQPDPLFSSQP